MEVCVAPVCVWHACVVLTEVRPSHVYCPSGSADAILALVNAGASVSADDKDGLTGELRRLEGGRERVETEVREETGVRVETGVNVETGVG